MLKQVCCLIFVWKSRKYIVVWGGKKKHTQKKKNLNTHPQREREIKTKHRLI